MRRISVFVDCKGEECGECHFKRMHSNAFPEYYACELFVVPLSVAGDWRGDLKLFRCEVCKKNELFWM